MKTLGKVGFLLVALLVGSTGWGQVYNKFAPATGIQKCTTSSYVCSAAAAADINAAFGSQTANTVLAAPNGSSGNPSFRLLLGADIPPINLGSTANGGVSSSSILLGTNGGTSNGFFSVTGPATSLKTFTYPNASATVLTTNAAVTVPQGGTGVATLPAHGVLLGEGTSNVSNVAAMAADTVLQGQGASADPVAVAVNNCGSASQALSYSTSTHTFGCQTISAASGANPTALVGLTAVNGVATTSIRSDGAPALDVTIAPTWTGLHKFEGLACGGGGCSGMQAVSTSTTLPAATDVENTTGTGIVLLSQGSSGTAYITGGPTGTAGVISVAGSAPLSIGTNGTERIRVDATGNVGIDTALRVNGNYVAFGNIANNGSACSIAAGSAQANLTSCSRTGAGATTVTFTNSQTLPYVCTITINVTAAVGVITNRSVNSISFTTFNLSGTATDLNYDFGCW